jgi:hypothetical protein
VPTPFCGVAMSSASSLSGKGTSGPRPDPIWAQTVRISEKDANRRYDVECIHCLEKFIAARPDQVRKHLTMSCTKVPAQIKREVENLVASKSTTLEQPAQLDRKAAKRSAVQSPLSSVLDTRKITPALKRTLDTKLLRCFIMDGISFRVADSVWFLDLLRELFPSYTPAGAYLLCTSRHHHQEANLQITTSSKAFHCRPHPAGQPHAGARACPGKGGLDGASSDSREPDHHGGWVDQPGKAVCLCLQRHLPKWHHCTSGCC